MAHQAKFKLFDDITITAGASVVSESISLSCSSGYFAVNGTLSGAAPDITLEYLTGTDDNIIASDTIKPNITDTAFHIQFFPEFGERIALKVTNNAASDVIISLSVIFSEN